MPWNTCTARCSHCGPESGPKDKTHIPHQRVIELIKEAGNTYSKPWTLSLSGGEIFLYYDRLLEYAQTAKSLGGYTTVITNCFWATSFDKAKELLSPLIDNNLAILGISYDKFHEPYIDTTKIRNAVKAAYSLGLKVHIRSVATKSNRLWQILEKLSDCNLWFTNFMEMTCMPSGRAILEIDKDELLYEDEFPTGKCPAATMTINPKGDAMICCNGVGELPQMNVGSVYDKNLSDLDKKFTTSALVDFLVRKSPAEAIKFLSQSEQDRLKNQKYVSVCHLCHDIFLKSENRKLIFDGVISDEAEFIFSKMPSLEGELAKFEHTSQ